MAAPMAGKEISPSLPAAPNFLHYFLRDELIDRLLEGVQNMKESVTYQKILREGRAEGQRRGSEEDPEATRKQAIWKARAPHRGCD